MKTLIVLFLTTLFVSGCASIDGPKFTQIAETPSGKSIVYLYKARVYGGDTFTIGVNGVPVTNLRKGGYYPYIAEPGKLELTSSIKFRITLGLIPSVANVLMPDSTLILNIEPGKTYYVKQTSGVILKLVEMPEETALIELEKCKLLPPFTP